MQLWQKWEIAVEWRDARKKKNESRCLKKKEKKLVMVSAKYTSIELKIFYILQVKINMSMTRVELEYYMLKAFSADEDINMLTNSPSSGKI